VSGYSSAALSPSGKKVAVADGRVVDTATGRVEHRYDNEGNGGEFHWIGSDDAHPILMDIGFNCSGGLGGCGAELTRIPSHLAPIDILDAVVGPPVQEGVVLVFSPTSIWVFLDEEHYRAIDLPQMPPKAPFGVVADVARDRLFAISSAGLVAEIEHLATKPTIGYHTVDLNGQPFDATWAGGGKIALWGKDGLGMIDTRTWTTQAVAPNVTGALATPLGLAAWTDDPADGITVYRTDGSARLHVLAGKPIESTMTDELTGKSIKQVTALGNYLYVNADNFYVNTKGEYAVNAKGEYSVDLRTGKVFGPVAPKATVVTPSLVPIP